MEEMVMVYLRRMSAWLGVDLKEYMWIFYNVEWSLKYQGLE